MQVNWESLTLLQNTGTDLWVLVPSGMIVGRLLKKDGTLMHPKRLVDYFGLSEKDILSRFYTEKTKQTLFGDETKISKLEQPTRRIAEIYVEKLHDIFKYVTKPMMLPNSRKVPIYHFVFASNKAVAKKIASYIIGKDS
jgi:three-Cys-motif partner protein